MNSSKNINILNSDDPVVIQSNHFLSEFFDYSRGNLIENYSFKFAELTPLGIHLTALNACRFFNRHLYTSANSPLMKKKEIVFALKLTH